MNLRNTALFALLIAGCTTDATQLIVVIDSDFSVPDELSFVRVEILGVESTQEVVELGLLPAGATPGADQANLPFSFGLVPQGEDAARQVTLNVVGSFAAGGEALVTRRVLTGFIEEKTLRVPIYLLRRCASAVAPACGAGQTCGENGCENEQRPAESLQEVAPGEELEPKIDGGPTDAEVDDRGDVGDPDAGPEDLGPSDNGNFFDGGPASCARELALATPRLLYRVQVGHPIDQPIVAADLDGDLTDEFIVTHTATAGGAFSVIKFSDCNPPSVTQSPDLSVVQAPLLGQSAGARAMLLPQSSGVRRVDYTNGTITPAMMLFTVDEVASLSLAPDRLSGAAVTRDTNWGYSALDLSGLFVFDETTTPIRGPLAYFAPEGTNGFSRFVALEGTSYRLLVALNPTRTLGRAGAAGGASEPVVVSAGGILGGGGVDRVVVASRDAQRLRLMEVDRTTLSSTVSEFALTGIIVAEPVPVQSSSVAVRIHALLGSGRVTYCEVNRSAPSTCRFPAESETFLATESPGAAGLLSAFVNGDARPDLLYVGSSGRVSFLDGQRIADPAAAALPLNLSPSATGAVSPGFWTRFGAPGDVLAVPHANGQVSFVVWSSSVAVSERERLWPQSRRDAQRSAFYP